MQDFNDEVEALIDLALKEDIGGGDVTSKYFVGKEDQAQGYFLVKQDGVVSGLDVAQKVFHEIDSSLILKKLVENGEAVSKGDRILEIKGRARSILTAERVALNFIQRLSGVATKTQNFVRLIGASNAKILDTRKTTPGWRFLEKKAVVDGGGVNHRMGLYDRAMVKDNHIVAKGGLASLQKSIKILKKERAEVEVEIEVDSLGQLKEVLKMELVDYILLDNMSLNQLEQAVMMRKNNPVRLEASGGVNESTVVDISKTGVDFISIGALTHSAVALDISLDFIPLA